MANIITYCEQELRSFAELPFGDVDSLVLSQLSYVQYENAVSHSLRQSDAVRLGELYRAELFDGMFTGTRVPLQNRQLLSACAASPRFRDIRLCGYEAQLDVAQQKQFAAVTYLLPDGSVYTAFRGTDGTLVGWKEDFNMAYRTSVPAQEHAALYLAAAMQEHSSSLFRVGGHSKGGNLAVFAALHAPEDAKERITSVYSHDGPGFRTEIFATAAYAVMSDRIRKTMPESAIIGMMLQGQEQYTVVKSDESWLGQHDPFSWQVEGSCFLQADTVTGTSEYLDETLAEWLETLPDGKRQELVDTVFSLLEATGASTLRELLQNRQKSFTAVYEAGKALDPETRSWLYSVFLQLCKTALQNIDILPESGRAAWDKLQSYFGSGSDNDAQDAPAQL